MSSGTLDELCTFLAANISAPVALVRGTNLFRSRLTDKPDVQVAVIAYDAGDVGQAEFGKTDGFGLEYARVQFHARGETGDFDTPNAILVAIRAALIQLFPGTIGTTRYDTVQPSSPYVLDRDENERVVCGMNARFQKEPS